MPELSARTVTLSADTVEDIGRLMASEDMGALYAWVDIEAGALLQATELYGLDGGEARDPAGLPAWMADERSMVARVLSDASGRYIAVPIAWNHGRPGLLREFISTIDDADLASELRELSFGRGAFRRVKDALARRGELELWSDFEVDRYVRDAVEWLAELGVRVDVGPD